MAWQSTQQGGAAPAAVGTGGNVGGGSGKTTSATASTTSGGNTYGSLGSGDSIQNLALIIGGIGALILVLVAAVLAVKKL